MINQKFEIKVALIGYVSVGKTTVLNAVLQEKFSEVSMRKTTAGVNFFRLISSENSNDCGGSNEDEESSLAQSSSSKETRAAHSILEEIKTDNQALREKNIIQEKVFDIKLEKNLFDMRDDTTLVLVDIPGINEADTNNIYMKYATDNWQNFDCVVLVMDARQGVNTKEQVDLLDFVKTNAEEKRDVPIIIVGNKVDDPDCEEMAMLVNEMSAKVAKVFDVSCRDKALKQILKKSKSSRRSHQRKSNGKGVSRAENPAVIPLSAIHAFFYRTSSHMSFEQFQSLDIELINRIGRDEFSKFKWKQMSEREKYKELYEKASTWNYEERLETTNFDKFLSALSYFVGGNDIQLNVLRQQLDVELKNLSTENCTDCRLCSMHEKCVMLGKSMDDLKDAFWRVYKKSEDNAIAAMVSMVRIEQLRNPVNLLYDYYSFVNPLEWDEERSKVLEKLKMLVRRQLGVIVNKNNLWNFEQWEQEFRKKENRNQFCNNCKTKESPKKRAKIVDWSWNSFSPQDWQTIFESVLLLCHNKHFCEQFGPEKILLTRRLKYSTDPNYCCQCGKCRSNQSYHYCSKCNQGFYSYNRGTCVKDELKMKFENGVFYPVDDINYSLLSQVQIPPSFSDPKHWGFTAWKYCKLVEKFSEKA